jgi:hypothetical protein
MSRYVVPAFPERTRSRLWLVLAGLIVALVWASSIGAQPSGHCHVHPTGQPLGSDNSIVGATEPLKSPAIVPGATRRAAIAAVTSAPYLDHIPELRRDYRLGAL